MRSADWRRDEIVGRVKRDIWRYISAASTPEQMELEAAALLQMRPREIRTAARIQLVLSEPAGDLIDQMPSLGRQLTTTSLPEQEISAERVRGAIRWGETFSERAATGIPHVYVTAPAARAFDTPENHVLVHALDAIAGTGRRMGWMARATDQGPVVRRRVEQAERALHTRALVDLDHSPPSSRVLNRVRSGRAARRYAAAVEVALLYREYMRKLDREAIRKAIETTALVATKDDLLLELLVVFNTEKALEQEGWSTSLPGLIEGGGKVVSASRDGDTLDVYFQRSPKELAMGSRYGMVQSTHDLRVGAMRPDLVFRRTTRGQVIWTVVEVKGVRRDVERYARDALQNLLAYRRAFDTTLREQTGPYGLGVAWGVELTPRAGAEILLCTPDTIRAALRILMR